jgi:hypothetical protein
MNLTKGATLSIREQGGLSEYRDWRVVKNQSIPKLLIKLSLKSFPRLWQINSVSLFLPESF